jgi:pSer/pThr/pTyr-binding forkhead associated (FHA) protein
MITCPICFNKELEGALFCGACGAQLTYQTKSPTETLVYTQRTLSKRDAPETQIIQPGIPSTARVAFKIASTGQVIALEGGEEFTIGRVSGTQPILPDIDLTPYQAYESGVSRLHATLHISQNEVTISDLGSANGTRVNGIKIPAHLPQSLSNGDRITFGKFQVEVIVHD